MCSLTPSIGPLDPHEQCIHTAQAKRCPVGCSRGVLLKTTCILYVYSVCPEWCALSLVLFSRQMQVKTGWLYLYHTECLYMLGTCVFLIHLMEFQYLKSSGVLRSCEVLVGGELFTSCWWLRTPMLMERLARDSTAVIAYRLISVSATLFSTSCSSTIV